MVAAAGESQATPSITCSASGPKLEVFLRHDELKIDNNPLEDAIRPTTVGKKNWLFVGGEDAGEQSGVIYTIIESARRHGHEPFAYIKDLLELLSGTKTGKLDALLPANWKPAGQTAAPA